MNFKKIKRTFSIGIAALMCFAVTLSVPAAAKTDDTVWKETKALAGASYSSKYIKWVEKYSEKDTTKTVTYSKSRTKKFLDKYEKNTDKDELQFALNISDKNSIISITIKGDKYKAAVYDGGMGMLYCGDAKNITFLDINNKQKCSLTTAEALKNTGLDYPDDYDVPNEIAKEASEILDLDIDSNEKGKLFKFISGEKTYYYEKFEEHSYSSVGFLFNENGNVIAANIDGDIVCMNVSYKVKDSEFNIPKDYNDVDYTDINWLN